MSEKIDLLKSHIDAYTRNDGTVVQAHDDTRVKNDDDKRARSFYLSMRAANESPMPHEVDDYRRGKALVEKEHVDLHGFHSANRKALEEYHANRMAMRDKWRTELKRRRESGELQHPLSAKTADGYADLSRKEGQAQRDFYEKHGPKPPQA